MDGVSSVQWSLASKITPSSGVTCGGTSSPGFRGFIIGRVFHKASSVTVTINFSVAQVGSSSNGPTVGVRDVTVLQKYAQNGDSQGFYIISSDSTIINYTGCNKGSFPTGNIIVPCQACPISMCSICIGNGGIGCMKSINRGSYFDGANFYSCSTGCVFCIGPNAKDCVQCDFSHTLDTDNTCKASCTLPYVSSGTYNQRCRLRCDSSQYLYWNNTCQDSCNYPLQIDTNHGQCTYPCNKAYAEFLYWNASCLSTCPFYSRIESGYGFCDLCPLGYYLYLEDDVCKLGCTYPYTIQKLVYCKLDLSSSDIEQTATMLKVINTGSLIQSTGSVIIGLLSPGDPSGFTLVALAKMLLYTRYMNLKYPSRLQSVLDQQDSSKPSLELLRKAQNVLKDDMRKYPLPGRFDHYGLHSSFLINFLEPTIIIISAFVITLLVLLLDCYCKQGTWLKNILEKVQNTLQWNLLITLYTSHYDGVILYASLEIRTTNSFYSFLPAASFFLTILSVVIALLISFKMIKIIRALNIGTSSTQEQRSQIITNLAKKHIKFQVFYASFRDSDLIQQSFFFIFTTRLIVFHIIIAVLIYHPLAQAILILLMNICMVLYLCFKHPMKSKLRLGQHIIQEIILLVVNICVLTVANIDVSQKEAYSTKRVMGEIFLYCNIILSLLGFAFPIFMIVEKLIALTQSKKPSESRAEVVSPHHETLPVNPDTRARQERTKANNDSNLVLIQDGLDQSQIYESSLGPSNLNFKSQKEGSRVKKSGLNQINTLEVMKNNRNISERAKEAKRTQLDHEATKQVKNISESHKHQNSNKSKIKKQNKLHSSLHAQHQLNKKLDIIYEGRSSNQASSHKLPSNYGVKNMIGISKEDGLISNAVSRDNPIGLNASLQKSHIEATWLQANQEKRYQIRDVEEYSRVIKENTALVDNDKYLNEPTLGNHSGVINLLKIRKPRNFDSKVDK